MTVLRRIMPAALLATACLALAGCAPDFWALSGFGGSGAPAPAPTSSAGPAGAKDESGDEENGCPVGVWLLDNATWAAELERLWRASAPEADVTVTGTLELDWDDAAGYVLRADRAQYVVSGVAEGVAFEQTVRHDGTESGAWSGAGSTYTLIADDSTGMTSVVTLAGAGGEQVFDQSAATSEPWSGTMSVTCTATGMTTTVTEESGSLTVAWTRR